MGSSRVKGRKRGSSATSKKGDQKTILVATRAAGLRLAALPGAAFVVCAYLMYAHYRLRHQLGWHSAFGHLTHLTCDPVLLAPSACIGPVPIAALGAGFYAAATLLAIRRIRRADGLTVSAASMLFAVGAFSGFVWLVATVTSLVTLRTLCWISIPIGALGIGAAVLARAALHRNGVTVWESLDQKASNDPGQTTLVFTIAVMLGIVFLLVYTQPPMLAPPMCEALAAGVVRPAFERPLELVEYSDFQCEFCNSAHEALRVVRAAPGIRIVHRQVPWDRACNPEADESSRPGECMQTTAAICAGDFGRYDQFSDRVFERAVRIRADLVKLADELGIDRTAFEHCLDSEGARARVRDELATAKKDGIVAIPTFLFGELKQRGFGATEEQCFR